MCKHQDILRVVFLITFFNEYLLNQVPLLYHNLFYIMLDESFIEIIYTRIKIYLTDFPDFFFCLIGAVFKV